MQLCCGEKDGVKQAMCDVDGLRTSLASALAVAATRLKKVTQVCDTGDGMFLESCTLEYAGSLLGPLRSLFIARLGRRGFERASLKVPLLYSV